MTNKQTANGNCDEGCSNREWEKRHKKMKRNNIYDYFYEVLTNFYDFLMGPHTVSGPLCSSNAPARLSERDDDLRQ